MIKVIIETIAVNKAMVRLSLDASRRWVRLSGVHPDFEGAINRQEHQLSRTSLG